MVSSQALTVAPAADLASVAPFLSRALPHDVAWPGQLSESVAGCRLFELRRDGQIVGAFAARVDRFETGSAIFVTCAGAAPGADVLPGLVAWIEQQARDVVHARQAQCLTARPGLVRQLKRKGYRVGGYLMTKDL